MNKQTLLLAVVVIILVVLGVWYFSSAPQPVPVTPADNSTAILNDVNSVDLGDLNSDFQGVNADINGL